MKRVLALALGLSLLAVLAGPSSAQSILDRRYTSAKLERFWQETLGANSPEPARFEMLAPGSTTAEPVRDAPPPDLGVPFTGDVIGESAGSGGTVRRVAFPVIPLSEGDGSVLIRRLAWSELYLNRYRFYERSSTDTDEVLAALQARQYSAALEAYLTTARLYFSAPDLQEKCTRLNRLKELQAGPLAGLTPDAPLSEWRALVPIHAATEARLGQTTLSQLVCSVKPVRGRGEMIRLVETRVREQIMREVRAKVEDTLRLLEAASAEFQALVNEMDVPISSAEILELERVLGNARANMLLVKEDQLKAATTIQTLKQVDLSSLNQPGQLSEFQQGQERMNAIIAEIEQVMSAVAGLVDIEGDQSVVADLAPCSALRGAYSALDLSLDTAALAQQINGPYEDCLRRARDVVARFQEPSLEKAQMAELARHVRQLSEAFLSVVNP